MKIQSTSISGGLESVLKEINEITELSKSVTSISVDDGCYDFMILRKGSIKIESGKFSAPLENVTHFSHQFPPPLKFSFTNVESFLSIKVHPWMNSFFFPQFTQSSLLNCNSKLGLDFLSSKKFLNSSFPYKVNEILNNFKAIDIKMSDQQILSQKICTYIYDKRGIVSVNELASIFRINRHRLNSIFLSVVKYNLKKFIVIVRITTLIKDKAKSRNKSFTDLAYSYGYFDQSHFNYDFKRITGTTPKIFFKNLPIFQERHI